LGIIQKQALRTTLINFFGAAFGGFTRAVMPLFISPTQIGLLGLLDSISGIFVTIFSMGYNQILVKIFPKYRNDENGHHGFLLFGFFLSLIGIAISFLIFYIFEDAFLTKEKDVELYNRFALLIFPMIFFRIIFFNIDGYARMLFNTVIGVFLETFINKVIVAIILISYALAWMNFDQLVYLYAFSFCIPGLLVLVFSFQKTKKITLPKKVLFETKQRKDIYEYILFGLLMGASASIVIYIDSLMIVKMLSLEMAGYYSIFFVAARFIIIPANGINRIAQVVLAESWEKNDTKNIQEVYEKSSLNQLLIGAYLLGVGWACLDTALSLSPKFAEYIPYKYVFLFLGIGLLIEMGTGVNTSIISTSKKYKFNTYFNITLAILVIVLNYFLIKELQLVGAAMASMLAMTIVNFLRWYFLYRTFQLQPFNSKFLKALILAIAFLLLCHFVTYDANPFLKLALNFLSLTIIFWGLVVGLKLSPDVNKWLMKMKTKFF